MLEGRCEGEGSVREDERFTGLRIGRGLVGKVVAVRRRWGGGCLRWRQQADWERPLEAWYCSRKTSARHSCASARCMQNSECGASGASGASWAAHQKLSFCSPQADMRIHSSIRLMFAERDAILVSVTTEDSPPHLMITKTKPTHADKTSHTQECPPPSRKMLLPIF